MHRFILRDENLDSAFLLLSKQLRAPIRAGVLKIPRQMGAGAIRNIPLEEGLQLRYSNLRYHDETEIIRMAKLPDSEIIFSMTFMRAATGEDEISIHSNIAALSSRIPHGRQSRTIEVLFSWEWVCNNLPDRKVQFGNLAACAPPAREANATSIGTALRTRDWEIGMLNEMEKELGKPAFNHLVIRSRVLLLVASIAARIPLKETPQPGLHAGPREDYYLEVIRRVEQRLVSSLKTNLPSQRELAREFAMSESTLKRYFKAIYGKTIYSYYLEKKMGLAKTLLQERKINVSETAFILGYEKVSAFIVIFKKYHKVLPGSLKSG